MKELTEAECSALCLVMKMPQREAIYNTKAALLTQEILATLETVPELELRHHPAYSRARTRKTPGCKMRIQALLLASGCEVDGAESDNELLIVRKPQEQQWTR